MHKNTWGVGTNPRKGYKLAKTDSILSSLLTLTYINKNHNVLLVTLPSFEMGKHYKSVK